MEDINVVRLIYKALLFTGKVKNQAEFGKKLGWKEAFTSKVLAGKQKYPSDLGKKLSDVFDEDLAKWEKLSEDGDDRMEKIFDEGLMFREDLNKMALSRSQKRELDEFVVLPVIEIGAKGGQADDITDLSHQALEYRKVPRSMFDDAEAILPVYGNSMSPGYPPGTEVAIARDLSGYFEFGDVYVIKIKNKARPLLKRVEVCDEDDCILLVSDNEMKRETGPLAGRFYYPPQKLRLDQIDEVWEVIGDCKRRKNKAIQLRQFREQQYNGKP